MNMNLIDVMVNVNGVSAETKVSEVAGIVSMCDKIGGIFDEVDIGVTNVTAMNLRVVLYPEIEDTPLDEDDNLAEVVLRPFETKTLVRAMTITRLFSIFGIGIYRLVQRDPEMYAIRQRLLLRFF
jgi:hypothetical protein